MAATFLMSSVEQRIPSFHTPSSFCAGMKEDENKRWRTTGLRKRDEEKLIKDFWDTINNPRKVSINILSDDDVKTYESGNPSLALLIAITVF